MIFLTNVDQRLLIWRQINHHDSSESESSFYRWEQGNFCLLGLFSGSSFVLTQVDNRVLTADEELQLFMLCSGSNSFFLDTACFLVDPSHSWELLCEEINFSMRNLHTKSWVLTIKSLYFSFPNFLRWLLDMAAVAGSNGFDWSLCWVI